jgi:hypothetical protein
MVPLPGPLSVEASRAISAPTTTNTTATIAHQAVRRRRSGGCAGGPSLFDNGGEPAGFATCRSAADSTGDVSAAVGGKLRPAVAVAAASVPLGVPAAAVVAADSLNVPAAAVVVGAAGGLGNTPGSGAWPAVPLEVSRARLVATALIEGRSDGSGDSMCSSNEASGPLCFGGSNVPAATRCSNAMEF